ncbi:H-NS histone family protein [Paraburkholderia sp. RP-4-7]|uniref:H-NS histone family protein n=1 Tax=Paraburkholderia polaris TaxID=2728848 RepID=A0A848IWG7_9BURK|nr:H-NS histone family protein [Paraburkholderia polaris]
MATLEQIQARVKKLQAQAEALLAKKTHAAVDQIRKLMLEHGLTTADIEARASTKRVAKGLKIGAAAGKTKVENVARTKASPKYQNRKTGATWTGHGRAPTWIAEARDRSKFLIAGAAEATVATTASPASKKKTVVKTASKTVGAAAHKGQRKGPQPALYRDPKSGATWSGRGPAPAWLASVKDRTRFLIDGAAAATALEKASKPKVATKQAVAKKVVTGKTQAAKNTGAPGKTVVTKSSAASTKAATKNTAVSPATRPAPEKVSARKPAAVNAAPAYPDATAAPEASILLSA